MKTQRMVFPRGKGIDVTEAMGTEILKIDGFFSTMDADAKKELKFNTDREKAEIKKIEGNVQIIEVPSPELAGEVETLTDDNEKLKIQIKELTAKLQAVELTKATK